MAAASGSSPSSTMPAGASNKSSPTGCLYCLTRITFSSSSIGITTTADLCSTTSRCASFPSFVIMVSSLKFRILPSKIFLEDNTSIDSGFFSICQNYKGIILLDAGIYRRGQASCSVLYKKKRVLLLEEIVLYWGFS